MEAKDTIVWIPQNAQIDIDDIRIAQANASFKAGLFEVKNWVNNNLKEYQGYWYLDMVEWEKQLKKWGCY